MNCTILPHSDKLARPEGVGAMGVSGSPGPPTSSGVVTAIRKQQHYMRATAISKNTRVEVLDTPGPGGKLDTLSW